MNFDAALRRYGKGLFTDHDVTRCTGISVRGWRELLKLCVVRTVTEGHGPGRVRMCDTTTFKRVAIIAALNRTGLSLAVSGRIAYFLPVCTENLGVRRLGHETSIGLSGSGHLKKHHLGWGATFADSIGHHR
jgi:hypothetical protein